MKEFGAQTAAGKAPPESPMKEFGALKQRDGLLSQADALQMTLANPKEYGSYKAFGAQRRSQPVMAPKPSQKPDFQQDSNKANVTSKGPDKKDLQTDSENTSKSGAESGDEGANTDDDEGAAIADRMNGAVHKLSDMLASPLPSTSNTLFGKSGADSSAESDGFKAVQRKVPQSPMMRTPVGVKKSILSSSLHGHDSPRAALDSNMNLSARSEHSPLSNNKDDHASSSLMGGVADAAQRLTGLLMSPKSGQEDHSINRPVGFPPKSPRKSPHKLSTANGGLRNLLGASKSSSDGSSDGVPTSKSESLRNLFAGSKSKHGSNNAGGGSLRNLLSSGTGGSLRNLFSSSSHDNTSASVHHHQSINLASMHASEHSHGSRDNNHDDDDGDSFHDADGDEEVPLKMAFQTSDTIREKDHDDSMGSLQVSPQTSHDDHSRTSFLSSVGDLPFGDEK
ncbi:MAG: hypothetical protein SGARI_001098 [Bacillariaceae sp.]